MALGMNSHIYGSARKWFPAPFPAKFPLANYFATTRNGACFFSFRAVDSRALS
jgi:hypothetical protein